MGLSRRASAALLAAVPLLAFLPLAGRARAQTPPDDDVGRRLERLERENEELRRRLEQIEKERAGAAKPPAAGDSAPAAPAPAPAPAPSPGAAPAPPAPAAPAEPAPPTGEVDTGQGSGFGIEVRYGDVTVSPKLFADVGFLYREPPDIDDNGQTVFFLGELDLFATASIGEKIQVLSETVIESEVGDEGEASGDDGEEFRVEVERLWVQYAVAPWLRIKIGREHDALTYWNRRFHHGAWVQTTLSRPRIVQFEEDDGILPIDVTGIELDGQIATSALTIEYVAALYNGRGRRPEDVQSAVDRNSSKAVSGHLRLSPAVHPSFWVGASFYYDEIPEDESRPERDDSIREWIYGAFFVEKIDRVEVLGEVIFVQHRDHTSDRTFHTFGTYLQVAVSAGDFTPYARFELVEVERGDPFYGPRVVDTIRGVGGVRYDVHDMVALKLEYSFAREEVGLEVDADERDVHRIGFQVAFVF